MLIKFLKKDEAILCIFDVDVDTYTELRNVKQCLFIWEILEGYTQLLISFVNIYIIIYILFKKNFLVFF